MLNEPIKILRMPEVRERTGLSTARIYELIALDLFPRQVRLGQRAVGWAEHEIQAWLASKLDCRSDQSKKRIRT